MNTMRILLALAWLAFAAPAAQAATPAELDRVVAVVNTEVITARELEHRIALVEQQLRAQKIQGPPKDALSRQVLERMIVDRAQMQRARDLGLRVDEAQVDRALGRIADENKIPLSELRRRVEGEGTPFARFRDDIREQILLGRLREREVDARVQVSEADVDAFLAETNAQGGGSGELNLSHILVRVPEGASPEQIDQQRRRAEDLARQIRTGADFGRLAASYSDGSEAMSGGSLGWRAADRLPQLFVDAVARIKPGETAGPLRSPAGFHLVKLIERRSASPLGGGQPIRQTRARHILIRITDSVPEAEAERRLRDVRERILAGTAEFAEMARQYSADGSAGRGGDLGWIYPGDTVPEFERAMDALGENEISQPVRTPFGVHLIQVQARRTDEMSADRQRLLARQALRDRRADENYQDWLRQLRDRTYVEYRLD